MFLSIWRINKELMPTVAEIIRSNFDLYKDFISQKDISEYLVDQNWIERNYNLREFYLLKYQTEFFGTFSFQKLNEYAYIGYFFIKNGYHRRGFGSFILKYIEIKARTENLNKIILLVHPEAYFAVNFYKKHNFGIIETNKKRILEFENGLLKDFYEEGSILMCKNLK